MSLEQKVNDGIKAAMLGKREGELRGLRAIKAAILLAKTAEGHKELTEEDEIKILQKMIKQRKDSLDIFRQQHREDLAKKEEEEMEVINKFLPKQLSEEEIKEQLQMIVKQVGANSPADMGKVMAAATKQLAGKADGKTISAIVKTLLTAN